MSQEFDVLIIGAGPGGYVCAIRAAQMGLKTAIVEGHKLGGECLNYGCIPSKALISAGHTIDAIQHSEKMGIRVKDLELSLPKLVGWKDGIVNQLTTGVEALLKANKVTLLKGRASFKELQGDKKVVTVDASIDSYDGSPSGAEAVKDEIVAKNVVIATGSSIIEIPSMKFDGKMILNSKQALGVEKIPKKIVVVGGGFIGLEIGTFYSKLGTEVVVVEATATLLPGTDRDCVKIVERQLKKKGIKVLLNTKASSVAKHGKSQSTIEVEGSDGTKLIDCDWVLVAVGRKPRTDGLNLTSINISVDQRGFIPVNSRLETSIPGVYAIGDVIGGPMLAHKASKEGMVVIETILNPNIEMDVRALPWAIFVDPEIATVGHTEESAKEAGWDPVVGKCPFAANGRALTTGHAEGFVKLIVDKESDQILGAHIVGPDASNLIAEIAVAIELGGTAGDLGRIVHAHPTLPETIMEAAENVHGMAVHIFSPKRKSVGKHP